MLKFSIVHSWSNIDNGMLMSGLLLIILRFHRFLRSMSCLSLQSLTYLYNLSLNSVNHSFGHWLILSLSHLSSHWLIYLCHHSLWCWLWPSPSQSFTQSLICHQFNHCLPQSKGRNGDNFTELRLLPKIHIKSTLTDHHLSKSQALN